MKKVLYTATVDIHIKSFHLPYLKLLHDMGYKVYVATNGNEEFPYCDEKIVVPFERRPFKFNNIKAIFKLKKIIDKENFNLIHCHTPSAGIIARLAARKARKKGTKVIYTAHGFHFYKGAPLKNWLIYYPIEKLMSRYTDTLITITKEDYELAKRKFKKVKNIEHVNGVGMNPERLNKTITEKEKEDIRNKLNIKKDDIVLSYIAELNSNKNQKMLIEVVKLLVKKQPNIKLLLIGGGILKESYSNLIKEYNLEKNISLLGIRTDIFELLSITDIYLASSLREGLPVNIIEAMYMGLPVVAMNNRGHRELIQNKINGFIINNKEEMINAIEELIDDKSLRNSIKNSGKKMSRKYLINDIIDDIKKIYNRKQKIMYLLASNKFSGAENVAYTIMKNIGNDYETIYCSPNGPIANSLKEKEVAFSPLKKLSYFQLKKVIKKIKPDIIHANDYKASCLASLFSSKCRVISHIHGNNLEFNRTNIKSILFLLVYRRFKKIIWVSNSALENYRFSSIVSKNSIVLYNVIDSNEVEKKSEEFVVKEKYDLVFLGRLADVKNPVRLIEIMKLIVNKNDKIKLAIVGDGDLRKEIENKIKENKLENNIKMFGFQKNPYPYLKKASILMMTSRYEGTPMAVLEALSLGLVIVSTPVDGLKDIIKDGENGFLLKTNEEIGVKILDIVDNDILMNNMKKKSVKIFKEINDLEKYINTLRHIYQ